MGVLLGQLNEKFNLADQNNYLNDLETCALLSKLFQLYNEEKEAKDDMTRLISLIKQCICDKKNAISSLKQSHDRIKEILDIKMNLYNTGSSKKDIRLESELDALLRKCTSIDFKINQCNHQIKRLPKNKVNIENNLTEIKEKISKIIEIIKIKLQQENFRKIKNVSFLEQECITYFEGIDSVKIKERLVKLFLKNYELEISIYQRIYDISTKAINSSSFRPSSSFDKKISFLLKFNNKIYTFILAFADLKNINHYKEEDINSLLSILSSLIAELTNTFEAMVGNGNYHKNMDCMFQLKEKEALNNKVVLKKYHLSFLHKGEINFYINIQQKFEEMINLIEVFFGKQDSSIPNVKIKNYYNK